jgi:hypothetical protein
MPNELDDRFYDRADAHILLSNDQMAHVDSKGKVSASMLYATARFNAWISAKGFRDGEEMAGAKEETLAYFCDQYRAMLEENLDDYIKNFSLYMKPVN